jgi:8-oxo-dGTP diphosphatase
MTKLILVAAAVLIDVDNRILIQKRPEGKPHAGFWEFPGGKIETGETPEAALVRELKEELNITTLEKAFFPMSFISHGFDDGHALIPLFGCRNWAGVPEPSENQELAWVKPIRLGDYNLLPSNMAVIDPLSRLI